MARGLGNEPASNPDQKFYRGTHQKNLFPCCALGGTCAETGFITTQHDHLCIWSLFQYFGQCTHENVISTIGFKIAIDESNHLIIALCVVAYGAFSLRPDKFDESEIRTLVRYKMEQYGAIPGDDYTIIERMLTV